MTAPPPQATAVLEEPHAGPALEPPRLAAPNAIAAMAPVRATASAATSATRRGGTAQGARRRPAPPLAPRPVEPPGDGQTRNEDERLALRDLLAEDRLATATGRGAGERLCPGGRHDDSTRAEEWGVRTEEAKARIVAGPMVAEWLPTTLPPGADTTAPASMEGRIAPSVPGTPAVRGMAAHQGRPGRDA